MIAHTTAFKNKIKEYGKEIDVKLLYNSTLLSAEDINSVNLNYSGNILKSVMKELVIDTNVEMTLNEAVTYSLGVKVRDDTVLNYRDNYDYITLGIFYVNKCEKKEDTNSYTITCYDKMLLSMVDYEFLNITYPITIRDYINAICTHLNITFANASNTFANYDKEIQDEKYLSYDETNNEYESLNYTFRDVLDELAQVTASTICINSDNELEIRYITDATENNEIVTIDEENLKNVNVTFKEEYGPINTIVLSRSGDSDNIYYPDPLPANPVEIKISDNQIMNGNDRDTYMADIYDKLNGLQFYLNDYSSTGIGYLDLCDGYNVQIGETTYYCIMLNDELNVTQGIEENIFTERLEESVTDYTKADKTDRKVNTAYIIAKKSESEIEALTRATNSLTDEVGNMYTIEQVNELIQNATTGLTNTFTTTGGNNILRNTGLWFKDEEDNYEYWTGSAVRGINDNAVNNSSIILQNGSFIQEQTVPNGIYTISFNYQLLNPLATAKVKINDVEYNLDSEDVEFFYTGKKNDDGDYITQPIDVTTKNIKIEFVCNIDGAVEVYDLMCNKGDTYATYTQNANETTTDTVNISQGITITSANMETIFKANANGIRILTLQGNLIAYFNDKGLSTKELVVETEAQIVKVLFQEVGDQTWITRI